MKKKIKEYCVGCGLCESLGKAECQIDKKGFKHPITGDEQWLKLVCPSCGNQQQWLDFNHIWGKTESVFYGWSSNSEVRKAASSGGVITEICCWMLDNHYADAILHVCSDPNDPTQTVCCESTKREEVAARCGSRYAISHPLRKIAEIDREKKYVFVGKPCDITTLRNYMELDKEMKNCIILTLSFFCAGLPSIDAQEKLMAFLNCDKNKVVSLQYRGNGWPGYATAIDQEGKVYQTDYHTSWGKILGRDLMKMCRFCLDGIGELADISCGDAWYLTIDKMPDFNEAEGRNVIFARNTKGKKLLDKLITDGRIEVTLAAVEDLKYIQAYQLDRRATMYDKLIALRVLGKPCPQYQLSALRKFQKSATMKKHMRVFWGTIKRILQGKI